METKGDEKNFVAVDLPTAFVAGVENQARLTGRSVAEQIVHYANIGKTFEILLPEHLSAGEDNIMEALGRVLTNKKGFPSMLTDKLSESPLPRFGIDPKDSNVAIMMLGDKEVRGRWGKGGEFIADEPVPE
jgi:hypothetical protein